jgi:acyl-coenzyme A synthetase/AMP-(fatty) acid ligase
MSGIRENGNLHSWQDIAKSARHASLVLSNLRGELIAVEGDTEVDLVIRTLAAIHAGAVPVLGNNVAAIADRIGLQSFPSFELSNDVEHEELSLNISDESEIAFCTSGSTGPGKVIKKSWQQLRLEVDFWRTQFSIAQDCSIISLVSMRHIYGHLFGFLLAFQSKATLHVVRPFSADLKIVPRDGAKRALNLIVSVPPTWGLAKLIFAEAGNFHFVTSGAPFGADRTNQLRNWADTHNAQILSGIEVLGSTETGGIGMRDLLADDPDFQLLPDVHIEWVGDAASLKSAYMHVPINLDDEIISVGARSIQWNGRRDRIIKFGAKRFSLDEFEQSIRDVVNDSATNVRCFFQADDLDAHGGELVAFVGPTKWTERDLRDSLSKDSQLPVPQKLFVLSDWPDVQVGKIGFDNLQSFATRSLRTIIHDEATHV